VIGTDPMAYHDGDELIGRLGGTADDLLGGRAVQVLPPDCHPILPGRAVDPGLDVGHRVESVDHDPVRLQFRGRGDLCPEETRVMGSGSVRFVLPRRELPFGAGLYR
jgi:hypothetical protein